MDGFDWDRGNRAKCQKHGVSVDDIEILFRTNPQIAPDLAHSETEQRFVAVGRNREGRAMFAAFTLRESPQGRLIRPISARFMHRKERDRYGQEGAQTDNG